MIDGSKLELVENGVSQGTLGFNGVIRYNRITLGSRQNRDSYGMANGLIDYTYIWDRTLSSEEIRFIQLEDYLAPFRLKQRVFPSQDSGPTFNPAWAIKSRSQLIG